MRLNQHTQSVIRDTVAELFGENAQVLLFGSRLDDQARGGDIDLLIKLAETDPDADRKQLTLIARLQRRLGDQPIDVLLIQPGETLNGIQSVALETGVRLG
ncbi:MAG: nucleotidyltransferase domain-containing protein [Wenzhouxiangella sp.]